MDRERLQISLARVLVVAAEQHGVVTRAQLVALGLTRNAIEHRLRRGRLHRVHQGVYAIGRPQLTRLGTLIAAVLSCGPEAALSHQQAAEVYGIRKPKAGPIEVTVPAGAMRSRPGVRVHRAALPPDHRGLHHGIPITTPVRTLVDLAQRLDTRALEAAVNEADKLDLVDPERLRASLEAMRGRRGVAALRELLERRTFTLTDSELERRFLPIARKAGLPPPLTQQRVNGFRVDFYWPELGLVVETDGLRYHRTPAQQARDRRRDQEHAAAGLTPLRFTYEQIARDAKHVETTLVAVVRAPKQPVPTASR
jgi:very-short-patch-repair endonuclease/predicted transcriptional regulator of viral defense system